MDKFPRCGECGGQTQLISKAGRFREYKRGVWLPIPDDFKIPTCIKCGEEYMSVEYSEPLDEIMEKLYNNDYSS